MRMEKLHLVLYVLWLVRRKIHTVESSKGDLSEDGGNVEMKILMPLVTLNI